MNKARSIKQNHPSDALPDFRKLGVTLRILLICNGMALIAALLRSESLRDVATNMVQISSLLTPVMLAALLLLWLISPLLGRLSYWQGGAAVVTLSAVLTALVYDCGGELYRPLQNGDFHLLRVLLLSMLMSLSMLIYFRARSQALSQALHDARLQVLRARIRPHFLYNTINAVLGILRSQPKLAETALEDMADLFRMAMTDEQDMVALQREIDLCKQYLALEKLRMGERLRVDWVVDEMPEDVQIPQLVLQPLLENAVYHGIEPLIEGGCIVVTLRCTGASLQLVVENPCPDSPVSAGNRIALQNIRERLELLFDMQAAYRVECGKNRYRVEITLPITRKP